MAAAPCRSHATAAVALALLFFVGLPRATAVLLSPETDGDVAGPSGHRHEAGGRRHRKSPHTRGGGGGGRGRRGQIGGDDEAMPDFGDAGDFVELVPPAAGSSYGRRGPGGSEGSEVLSIEDLMGGSDPKPLGGLFGPGLFPISRHDMQNGPMDLGDFFKGLDEASKKHAGGDGGGSAARGGGSLGGFGNFGGADDEPMVITFSDDENPFRMKGVHGSPGMKGMDPFGSLLGTMMQDMTKTVSQFMRHDAPMECNADVRKINCSDAKSQLHCLAQHADELSEGCHKGVQRSVPFHCSAAIERLCDTLHDSVMACLGAHIAELHSECKDAVLAAARDHVATAAKAKAAAQVKDSREKGSKAKETTSASASTPQKEAPAQVKASVEKNSKAQETTSAAASTPQKEESRGMAALLEGRRLLTVAVTAASATRIRLTLVSLVVAGLMMVYAAGFGKRGTAQGGDLKGGVRVLRAGNAQKMERM